MICIYGCLLLILIIFFCKIKKLIKIIKISKIGKNGEKEVKLILDELNPSKYCVINDVMLFHHNKKLTQIDHIVVSRKGVFVIETKNYSGVVFGNFKGQTWTHLSVGKHLMYNPILQNNGHIRAVKNISYDVLTKLNNKKYNKFFISVIVFNDNCKVKIYKRWFRARYVKIVKFSSLYSLINGIHRFNMISKSDFLSLVNIIKKSNVNSRSNYRLHLRQLKR